MKIIHLGGTAWLACEKGRGILIDTAMRPGGLTILRRIRSMDVQVSLIFLTHTHYDHTGGVEAIRQATGARVMVGEGEAPCLRDGYTPVPKGTDALGRFLSRAAHCVQPEKREHYAPVTQDLIEAGEAGTLEEFGFDARYTHLGGHSVGSAGLSIGDYFFAGDTVFNIGAGHYPPFADYPEEIPAAWRAILSSGAKYICPGHGRMLKVERLRQEYTRRFGTI